MYLLVMAACQAVNRVHERGGGVEGPFDARSIMRPAYFVPDTKPVDELLEATQSVKRGDLDARVPLGRGPVDVSAPQPPSE